GEGDAGQDKAQTLEQGSQRQQQRQAQQQLRHHDRRQRRLFVAATFQGRLDDQHQRAGGQQAQQQQRVGTGTNRLVGEGGFQPPGHPAEDSTDRQQKAGKQALIHDRSPQEAGGQDVRPY